MKGALQRTRIRINQQQRTIKNDNGQAAKADILEDRTHNDKLTREDDSSSVRRIHGWGRHYL